MAETDHRSIGAIASPQKHKWTRRYLCLRIISFFLGILPRFKIALDRLLRHPVYLSRWQVKRKRLLVPSRDKGRTIKVDVYTPNKGVSKPSAVHIHWHGCAFFSPIFGIDAKICSYLANKLGCIVMDADYRKTPMNPFPASHQDALDVCYYVLAHPELYDAKRISLGGCSSGANIALGVAANLGPKKICAVCANAPPTNSVMPIRKRKAKDPGCHPFALIPWQVELAYECLLRKETDLADPLLSPYFATTSNYPNVVSISTGTGDSLYYDGETLINKLIREGHPNARFTPLEGLGHAFEPKSSIYTIMNDFITTIRDSWTLSDRTSKL